MSYSEEDYINFHSLVSYLDTMQETADGTFQQVRRAPVEILQEDMEFLVASLEKFAHENYAQHHYEKALRSYTRQLKLLTLWQVREQALLDEIAHCAIKYEAKTEHIERLLSSAHFHRGNTYSKLAEYDKALKDYDCALDVPAAELRSVLLNRALLYEKLGQLEKAEQDLLQAHESTSGRLPDIEHALARIQSKRHTQEHMPWWRHLAHT